jgi:hypothetical protein
VGGAFTVHFVLFTIHCNQQGGFYVIRRATQLTLILLAAVGLSGCIAGSTPAIGVLMSEVTWDGMGKGELGTKEGKACAQSILGLVAQGDASIKAAAKAGGITNISSVDHYTKNTLGILGEYCTIVRGH